MIRPKVGKYSKGNGSYISGPLSYFILTVLGFSFWFFAAVPFASHRESYWWLGMVHSQKFSVAFTTISKTYRPFAQGVTWLGFRLLNPNIFPTSVFRQTLVQLLIYGLFVLAWWLIYRAVGQTRLFSLISFVAGGVFFSGYVQLFHIYGIFYVAVILTLGALLYSYASGSFGKCEVWFSAVAILLAFWHPYATALFVGFFFGYYLETFRKRSKLQRAQGVLVLLVGLVAIAALVVLFPTRVETITLSTRLMGFLVSYQTNEVNRIASLVAFLMAQMVVFSMEIPSRIKLASFLSVTGLSLAFFIHNVPILLVWLSLVLIKLLFLRSWSLFFLALAAVLFPFGGAIGTPIYGLFAIIVAVYVTALGWSKAETALSFFETRICH